MPLKKILPKIVIVIILILAGGYYYFFNYILHPEPRSYAECQKIRGEGTESNFPLYCEWYDEDTPCERFPTARLPRAYADRPFDCTLYYYNPNFKFPENFADCRTNYQNFATRNNQFTCEISLPISFWYNRKVYNKSVSKKLIQDCKEKNGYSANEDQCDLTFFSENGRVPDSPDNCHDLGGEKITKEVIGNGKAIYTCQTIYNSQNHENLYNLCLKKTSHRLVDGQNQSKFCIYEFDFEADYFNMESIM